MRAVAILAPARSFRRASVVPAGLHRLSGNVATPIARQGLLDLVQSQDTDVRVEGCGGACISRRALELGARCLAARRMVPRLALRQEISLSRLPDA